MTKLQEFLEYRKKECENERKKYNHVDYSDKNVQNKNSKFSR